MVESSIKPTLQLFHACLVGMKYYQNSKSEYGKLKDLNESYSDINKIKSLFIDTLKWDESRQAITVFNDEKVLLRRSLFKDIQDYINDLKTAARMYAKPQTMAFNLFAFVGHGFIDDKDRALFLVNTKG